MHLIHFVVRIVLLAILIKVTSSAYSTSLSTNHSNTFVTTVYLSQIWKFAVKINIPTSPALNIGCRSANQQSNLYFMTKSGFLLAIDGDTGKLLWSMEALGKYFISFVHKCFYKLIIDFNSSKFDLRS